MSFAWCTKPLGIVGVVAVTTFMTIVMRSIRAIIGKLRPVTLVSVASVLSECSRPPQSASVYVSVTRKQDVHPHSLLPALGSCSYIIRVHPCSHSQRGESNDRELRRGHISTWSSWRVVPACPKNEGGGGEFRKLHKTCQRVCGKITFHLENLTCCSPSQLIGSLPLKSSGHLFD